MRDSAQIYLPKNIRNRGNSMFVKDPLTLENKSSNPSVNQPSTYTISRVNVAQKKLNRAADKLKFNRSIFDNSQEMNSLKSEDGSSMQNSEDEITYDATDKTRLVTGIGVNRVTIGDKKLKRNTQNLAK